MYPRDNFHHFGFGTTAEVLKAGLPSIPIPHLFDQKVRATKVYKLAYASKPLDYKKLNSDKLAGAIIGLKSNQEIKENCLKAGSLISKENGLDKAVYLINKYISSL